MPRSHHAEVLRLRSELRAANEKIGELKSELSAQPSAVHEAEYTSGPAIPLEGMTVRTGRRHGSAERRRWKTLFDAIKHGDQEHQDWLRKAIDDHFAGREVERSRGSGSSEAEQAVVRAAMEWHGNLEDALALNLSDHSLAKACDNLAKVREESDG